MLREEWFDLRAGIESVLSFANRPASAISDLVIQLDAEIARQHANDRDLSIAAWLGAKLGIERHRVDDIEDVLWRSTLRLTPAAGILACLTRLVSDELPIAAVSNASFTGRVMSHELERHGLARHFAFVLTSADVGYRKPSGAIFARALELLGADARDVWFVGDTWHEDITGAYGAGLVPFWLSSSSPPSASDVPSNVVADWTAFLDRYALAIASQS